MVYELNMKYVNSLKIKRFNKEEFKQEIKNISYWVFIDNKNDKFEGFISSDKFKYITYKSKINSTIIVDKKTYLKAHNQAMKSLTEKIRILKKHYGYKKASKIMQKMW